MTSIVEELEEEMFGWHCLDDRIKWNHPRGNPVTVKVTQHGFYLLRNENGLRTSKKGIEVGIYPHCYCALLKHIDLFP